MSMEISIDILEIDLQSIDEIFHRRFAKQKQNRGGSRGGETGEFSPPFFWAPLFLFFLIPQILIGSITLLQKFTPHFKILDPRLPWKSSDLRPASSKTVRDKRIIL